MASGIGLLSARLSLGLVAQRALLLVKEKNLAFIRCSSTAGWAVTGFLRQYST